MSSPSGFEPGLHLWEASVLTTTPFLNAALYTLHTFDGTTTFVWSVYGRVVTEFHSFICLFVCTRASASVVFQNETLNFSGDVVQFLTRE